MLFTYGGARLDPITGTAIAEATKRVSAAAQAPVFGSKITTITTRKNGSIEILEDSYQIRAWEIAALGAVGLLIYGFGIAPTLEKNQTKEDYDPAPWIIGGPVGVGIGALLHELS